MSEAGAFGLGVDSGVGVVLAPRTDRMPREGVTHANHRNETRRDPGGGLP